MAKFNNAYKIIMVNYNHNKLSEFTQVHYNKLFVSL
jgi:hypothetical protein